MTHTYKITGMTCGSCKEKIENLFKNIKGVTMVNVNIARGEAEITMDIHINTSVFQEALKIYPKYQISDVMHSIGLTDPGSAYHSETKVLYEERKTWFETYKPVILIFAFITGITLLVQYNMEEFMWMEWMNHFMSGFFITFSFFKLLNLSGFADSYMSYDIIAKRWRGWGFVYAFVELGLGIAYLINFDPIITNIVTLIVMGLSIIGVLQSVLNKRKIKCACLGDVFNLPMSTITIIEDGLMLGMSAIMLFNLL